MPASLEELLKTTPQLSRSDLEYLQEWASKQPHLPHLEDLELVPLLCRSEYSVERTKDYLDKYLTMRTHAPEMFAFRDPNLPANKEQLKFFHVAKLGLDSKGNRIVCLGFEPVPDLSAFDTEASSYIVFSLMELGVREEPTTPGYVFVLNAEHFTTGHLTKASVSLLKKGLSFLEEGAPARILAVHIINLNPVVDKLMLIIRPFLSKEVQNKLHFHSKSRDAFYSALPKDSLPQEYGGSLGKTSEYHKISTERLLENVEYLKSLEKRVVDETKRPGRAKGEGDVFGVDGTFKRLDFD